MGERSSSPCSAMSKRSKRESLLVSKTDRESVLMRTQLMSLAVRTKQFPDARDGHSAFLVDDHLFIFGGDQHHLSLNDLAVMPLK